MALCRIGQLGVLVCCFLLTTASWSWSQESAIDLPEGKSHTLALGKVTSQPRKHWSRFSSLAAFLTEQLQPYGIDKVVVRFAKNNEEMIGFIKNGSIDFISETMFSSMVYLEQGDMEILVREWRNNVPEYHSVFFVRRDSPVHGLSEATGKVVAFEDPGSTSAYFLPRVALLRQGYRLQEVSWPGPAGAVGPADGVGYVFAKTEDNIPIWVHEHRVDIGVLSDTDWQDEKIVPPVIKKDLHIIHETESVPRSLLLVHAALPKQLREKVKELLLAGHTEHPEGVVEKFSRVPKYDDIPDAEIARFKQLYQDFLSAGR